MTTEWVIPAPNYEWLSKHCEDTIDPDMPIIDAHHHLWVMPNQRYMLPEFLRDIDSGHNIEATIYMEGSMAHRTDGPEEMRPVGETEFAGEAALATHGRVANGIVAFANLRSGGNLEAVLSAHIAAGQGRLRGIRDTLAWHPDLDLRDPRIGPEENSMDLRAFHDGLRLLGAHDLVFDVWLYFTQLKRLAELAKATPETRIVVNHVGAPLGIGRYKDCRREVFKAWKEGLEDLSASPNVYMKIGGLAAQWTGLGFHEQSLPPSSEMLAEAWRPYIEPTVEAFGADRCMFESNFPVDAEICSYVTLWNAFKRVAAQYATAERRALFHDTAVAVYRLELPRQNGQALSGG